MSRTFNELEETLSLQLDEDARSATEIATESNQCATVSAQLDNQLETQVSATGHLAGKTDALKITISNAMLAGASKTGHMDQVTSLEESRERMSHVLGEAAEVGKRLEAALAEVDRIRKARAWLILRTRLLAGVGVAAALLLVILLGVQLAQSVEPIPGAAAAPSPSASAGGAVTTRPANPTQTALQATPTVPDATRPATPLPSPTPLPVPTVTPTPCPPSDRLGSISVDDLSLLGCGGNQKKGWVVIAQEFMTGVMVIFNRTSSKDWIDGPGAVIYVLSNDGRAWRVIDQFIETSKEQGTWYSCAFPGNSRPEYSRVPWRGFGKAWCDNPDIRRALGNAKSGERTGATADWVGYDRGRVFRLSNWFGFPGWTTGRAYVTFLDSDLSTGRWAAR